MTTIIADCRTGTMVSDSKVTAGTVWFPAKKVVRHKDELIGLAGEANKEEAWLNWYTNGRKGKAPNDEDLAVLILRKTGLFYVDVDSTEIQVMREFHAIGSGAPAAMGALLAGKTAEEAVAIAILVDPDSGGDIQLFSLTKDKA